MKPNHAPDWQRQTGAPDSRTLPFHPRQAPYDPTEVCPHTCIFVSAPNTLTTMFAATILAPQTPP
jgi:hypothetical protein